MTIEFNNLYSDTHSFNSGTANIPVTFTGNLLAIECSTKPEYAAMGQTIGTLYQYNGTNQKAYAIKSGKDVIKLDLPETTAVEVPETLLALPARVNAIDEEITALQSAQSSANWETLTGKPSTFPPAFASFLAPKNDTYYRFIRLRQTGLTSDGGYYFVLSQLEFFGILKLTA